jgi:hypothetical protein
MQAGKATAPALNTGAQATRAYTCVGTGRPRAAPRGAPLLRVLVAPHTRADDSAARAERLRQRGVVHLRRQTAHVQVAVRAGRQRRGFLRSPSHTHTHRLPNHKESVSEATSRARCRRGRTSHACNAYASMVATCNALAGPGGGGRRELRARSERGSERGSRAFSTSRREFFVALTPTTTTPLPSLG